MKEIYVVVDEPSKSGTGFREMLFCDNVSAQDYGDGKLVITRSNANNTNWQTIAVFNAGHWKQWRGYETGIYKKDERVDTDVPQQE